MDRLPTRTGRRRLAVVMPFVAAILLAGPSSRMAGRLGAPIIDGGTTTV